MSTKHTTFHQLDRERPDYTTWSHEALLARKRELTARLLEHYPMPATETDEDAYIDRLLQQHKHLFRSAAPTEDDASATDGNNSNDGIDGNELLQEVSQFIARYLQCSEHQRTLLALWVLHTYCFCAARVTPYLAIRSADKQSGKTLCLQLLSLLCDCAALTSGGFTARDLALPMKEKPIDALLFDECHLTVGTRTRPRSPALRAVLAGSFHLGIGHRNIAEERNAFLPKAFASQAALPEELADRCIPIILEPLHTKSGPQPPPAASSALNPFENPRERERAPSISSSPSTPSTSSTESQERFDLHHIADQIKPLRDRLERWTKNHFSLLTRRTLLPRSVFPPNLSPRQQDLCDPLLQIAALVGGPWIARALQACAIVFDLQSIFELRPNLQLLADVRDCFAHHNWPGRLPTEALLDWTDSLPSRPWDAEGPLSAYKLARLLGPFEIRPQNQRIGKADPRRGYELKDFKEPWKKHLGFEVPQPEIANKNAVCNTISLAEGSPQTASRRSAVADNTVSQVGKPSASAQIDVPKVSEPQKNPEWTVAAPGRVFDSPALGNRRKDESVGSGLTQPRPAVPAPPAKPAKNAACNTDSHVRTSATGTQEHPTKRPPSSGDPMTGAPDARVVFARGGVGVTRRPDDPISPDTLHGIHRLKTLHSKLRLQGICPPFEALAASYLPHHLHAALDWVEAHPEWLANLRYKPALEFVAAFQKTLAVLTMKGA